MKLLVYGAGVIGSYLTHVLCAAGHDVALVARGRRYDELQEKGLVVRHYLQGKTTTDHPRIVQAPDAGERYDAVFAVMQYQQMRSVLEELAGADCPLVILVGNNLSAPEMEETIRQHSRAPKTILFGFQATGGRRENGSVICIRPGAGRLQCGLLYAEPEEAAKAALERIFHAAGYRPCYQPGMDAWYKCHLALILPIAYVCYALDCDLTRATCAQLRQVLEAAREGYGLLRAQGYPILPQGDERYFEPGRKRAMLSALLWLMAKTALGRFAASDHCRSAVAELEALDGGFLAIRAKSAGFPMPAWDALRSQLPPWATLHGRYPSGRPQM